MYAPKTMFFSGLLALTAFGNLSLAPRAVAEDLMAPAPVTYSDAQIAEIMRIANEGEINAGNLAVQNASNAKVKTFAQKMVDEHTANMQKERLLIGRQSLAFDRSARGDELRRDAETKLAQLKGLRSTAFDRAYVRSQIEMHQSVLNELDNNLIPQAKNAELKAYLQETREHVKAHLDEAKQLPEAP